MDNIIIRDKAEFERKLKVMKQDGAEEIHVVSDFDKTITKAFADGKKIMSSFALLRESGLLDPELVKKDMELFDKYYPLERDSKLSDKEKYQAMEEWWVKHHQLMVDYGFNKSILAESIKNYKTLLREGSVEMFNLLSTAKIPLLIFSAGMGNVIKLFLQKEKLLTDNVHIISNFFKFDEKGKAISYNDKLIHVFSKNEVEVKDTPYHKEVASRKNVILLGDNLADLGMSAGMQHDEVLTIGFLNEKENEWYDKFVNSFDVVILKEGSMNHVNDLLKKIL
jgi:cytosolic 5'-nucleotidase 3